MLITLAYPYEGHQPDATIEIADEIARQLIADGRARVADPATDDNAGPPAGTTLHIVLAYPYDGHEPETLLEVDASLGRQLIADGRARHAAPADTDHLAPPTLATSDVDPVHSAEELTAEFDAELERLADLAPSAQEQLDDPSDEQPTD